MKRGTLALLVLFSTQGATPLFGASACPSDASAAQRNFLLINVKGASSNTLCTQLNTQIRDYSQHLEDGSYDSGFVLATPPQGAAVRTLNPSEDNCSVRDDGTADTEDFPAMENGVAKPYNGHLLVLVSQNQSLPARIAPAAYVKGNLPNVGAKWKRLYFLTGNGTGSALKACSMTSGGVVMWFCRVCTSNANGN
jgi:hypothetical protein